MDKTDRPKQSKSFFPNNSNPDRHRDHSPASHSSSGSQRDNGRKVRRSSPVQDRSESSNSYRHNSYKRRTFERPPAFDRDDRREPNDGAITRKDGLYQQPRQCSD